MAKINVTKPPVKKKATPVKEEEADWEEGDEEEEKPKKKKKSGDLGPPVYKYRYLASLQDPKEPNLYRDFAESNSLTEIKNKSEKEVESCLKDDGLDIGVLVLDREGWFVTYRYNLVAQTIVERDRKGNIKITNDAETRIKAWVKDR